MLKTIIQCDNLLAHLDQEHTWLTANLEILKSFQRMEISCKLWFSQGGAKLVQKEMSAAGMLQKHLTWMQEWLQHLIPVKSFQILTWAWSLPKVPITMESFLSMARWSEIKEETTIRHKKTVREVTKDLKFKLPSDYKRMTSKIL